MSMPIIIVVVVDVVVDVVVVIAFEEKHITRCDMMVVKSHPRSQVT